MHDHDPYRPPQVAVVAPTTVVDAELAGRGRRLAASLVDALIIMAITLPPAWLTGYLMMVGDAKRGGDPVPLGWTVGWLAAGILTYAVVQGFPLYRDGQTWGKKLLGIRIVGLDGRIPGLLRLLVLRHFVGTAIAQVPLVGPLYTVVDALFVFTHDRRCIHDLIARTRVVKVH